MYISSSNIFNEFLKKKIIAIITKIEYENTSKIVTNVTKSTNKFNNFETKKNYKVFRKSITNCKIKSYYPNFIKTDIQSGRWLFDAKVDSQDENIDDLIFLLISLSKKNIIDVKFLDFMFKKNFYRYKTFIMCSKAYSSKFQQKEANYLAMFALFERCRSDLENIYNFTKFLKIINKRQWNEHYYDVEDLFILKFHMNGNRIWPFLKRSSKLFWRLIFLKKKYVKNLSLKCNQNSEIYVNLKNNIKKIKYISGNNSSILLGKISKNITKSNNIKFNNTKLDLSLIFKYCFYLTSLFLKKNKLKQKKVFKEIECSTTYTNYTSFLIFNFDIFEYFNFNFYLNLSNLTNIIYNNILQIKENNNNKNNNEVFSNVNSCNTNIENIYFNFFKNNSDFKYNITNIKRQSMLCLNFLIKINYSIVAHKLLYYHNTSYTKNENVSKDKKFNNVLNDELNLIDFLHSSNLQNTIKFYSAISKNFKNSLNFFYFSLYKSLSKSNVSSSLIIKFFSYIKENLNNTPTPDNNSGVTFNSNDTSKKNNLIEIIPIKYYKFEKNIISYKVFTKIKINNYIAIRGKKITKQCEFNNKKISLQLKQQFDMYCYKYNTYNNSNLMIKSTLNLLFKIKFKSILLQKKNHFQTMSRGPIAKKKKSLLYFNIPYFFKKLFLIGKIKILKKSFFLKLYLFFTNGYLKSLKKNLNTLKLII